MSSLAPVAIHPSQFPDRVRRDLLESLRIRQVNHKFHYDSIKQTLKWLALHAAYSPSRIDPDCAAIYDRGFEAARSRLQAPLEVIDERNCFPLVCDLATAEDLPAAI